MNTTPEFKIQTEQFADIRILRYQVPGFENLALNDKVAIYYLSQAALWGRDILWDQNYKHNLLIRKSIENIIESYSGDKETESFKGFMTYAKKVFFSNGIHHHYSMDKFFPTISQEDMIALFKLSNQKAFPMANGQDFEAFLSTIINLIYNPQLDNKRVSLDATGDLVKDSACNYYQNINEAEANAFYVKLKNQNPQSRQSFGLNSTLCKKNDKIVEEVWKIGGKYSAAIEKMVENLKKALPYIDSIEQQEALHKLIEYYHSGDLNTFDEYSLLWLKDVHSTIDIIHGFIEVYGDPLGKKASYESLISIIDPEATQRAKRISDNAEWFEQHSSTAPEHKKDKIKGVNARAVFAVMEAGDCSPSTPIGINLPNADWIRAEYGSKSVSISNIIDAYDLASQDNGSLQAFAWNEEEIRLSKNYGALASKLHVDLHEIVGHGSGKIEAGVAEPSETLKNYASTLEEARADLVALYFAIDPKLIALGLMPNVEVGYTEYNSYIRSGLMTQLVRIEEGKNLEESHMRNRQLIAQWAYQHGKADKVIEKKTREGNTYFVINDYQKLRLLFGELLHEVQRIKSQGDYQAGKHLVETYGVKIDSALHKEVLQRWEALNIAPYAGFINPEYQLVQAKDGTINNVKICYPNDFVQQMMQYGSQYNTL